MSTPHSQNVPKAPPMNRTGPCWCFGKVMFKLYADKQKQLLEFAEYMETVSRKDYYGSCHSCSLKLSTEGRVIQRNISRSTAIESVNGRCAEMIRDKSTALQHGPALTTFVNKEPQ